MNEFEPICTCGECEAWIHNLRRLGRASALRSRDAIERGAQWMRFVPDESPTLRASGLDLRSEFSAGQIAAIAREAVRPSFGPPRL